MNNLNTLSRACAFLYIQLSQLGTTSITLQIPKNAGWLPHLESKDGSDTDGDGAEADGVAVSSTGENGRDGGAAGSRSAGGSGRAADEAGRAGGRGSNDEAGGLVATDHRDGGGLDVGSGSGSGSLGADSAGDLADDNASLGSIRAHSGGGSGASSSGNRGRRRVVRVGDAELDGVLVLASALDNKEDTVVGGVRLEGGAGSPRVTARVVDVFDNGLDGDDVGAGAAQKDKRHSARGSGVPGDLEGLASRNNLVQFGGEDGIAGGVLRVVGLSVGRGQGRKGRDKGGGEETHFYRFTFVSCA